MLKDIVFFTPHQILDNLGFVIEKPKPDENLIASTINNLPIANRKNLELLGYGDWSHGRSSGGSVVLSNVNFVLKFALGEQFDNESVLEKVKVISGTARKFYDVSPKTGFFIAQVDGIDKPAKMVIYQARNHGKPVCNTPLKKLLCPEITQQFVTIIDQMIEVLRRDNLLDNIGIHLNGSNTIHKFIIKAIRGLPWISDNIMIERNKVELVDNVPVLESHKMSSNLEKLINIIRLKFSKMLIRWSSLAYSYIVKPY